MGITRTPTTFSGCYTVICSSCGGKEDWDISEEEYEENINYYDNWRCPDCLEIIKKRGLK